MKRVELCLLGGFELRIDGKSSRLQPVSQRLLALVALFDRRLLREFVAFQLWPDTQEQRALANLRTALWRLGDLSDLVLDVSSTHVALAPDVWLDVRDGIQNLVDGEARAAATMPFSTFRSELLPDWYDDWLVVERERLRQLSLRLLTSQAQAALERGATFESIELALGALSIEPHHDRAHDILTAAHLAEGNLSEARRELRRFESVASG